MQDFVLIRPDRYYDEWYEELNLVQAYIWDYLITCPHVDRLGVIKRSLRRMVQDLSGRATEAHIEDLLEQAKDSGKIIRHESGALLIVNWFRHQRNGIVNERDKAVLGALSYAKQHIDSPLVPDWLALYFPDEVPAEGLAKGLQRASVSKARAEQEQEAEQEQTEESSLRSDSLPVTDATGPRRSPHKKRDLAAIEAAQKPLVERLGKIIALARFELGLAVVDQDEDAAPRIIRQLVELDGVLLKDIEPVCRWMFSPAERKFYADNLSLIHNWRKKWENGIAFCTARDKWKLSQQPDTARDRQSTPGYDRKLLTPRELEDA